ncbi:MAG: MerR family transcriptional regulator [Spirochaetales bacterium]|nr:MerR family transcriptional regulator [Spirochaetales bacterium]
MYNIETLAKLTGLTRRTIRYYIQREILDPPLGSGRGSYYTDLHVEQLKKIKEWADQGVPLIHMKEMLRGKIPRVSIDLPTGVKTTLEEGFEIADGIKLTFRPGQLLSEDLVKIRDFISNVCNRREE